MRYERWVDANKYFLLFPFIFSIFSLLPVGIAPCILYEHAVLCISISYCLLYLFIILYCMRAVRGVGIACVCRVGERKRFFIFIMCCFILIMIYNILFFKTYSTLFHSVYSARGGGI